MAFRERLDNGLVLRAVESEEDIVRYVDFNGKFNNPQEGATCNILLRHHPGVNRQEFQLVEDERTGGFVSTTCLIPWQCGYEGITLKAAMLEMVLSHPAYRKAGLVKLQVGRFLKIVEDAGYDLSIIWGIPYYYRQFGYAYCINGNTADVLPLRHIPDAAGAHGAAYSLRKATTNDVQELTEYYAAAARNQAFHVKRDAAHWHYLINYSKIPAWLVVNNLNGATEGYIVYHNDGGRIHIAENGIVSRDVGMAVLQLLKREAKKDISISWPENNILVKLARSFGSVSQQPGQWLLRIRDIPEFLIKIGPALEKRLAASECSGVSQELIINLFRQAYIMEFKEGKLAGVKGIGFKDASMGADGGDLCIPPDAFVRLVFGFRTLEQLTDAWPDIVVKPESRYLLETLFPTMTSYINTAYHYQGAE